MAKLDLAAKVVHPNGDTFDYFVLQGHYGGQAGWEDLTAETSLEQILMREDEYIMNDPAIPYQIQSVSKSGKRRRVKKYPTAFMYKGTPNK